MTDEARQDAQQHVEPRRMLTVAQVLEIIPVSRTTLFKMERRGTFPASHYASANRRFWYGDEIAAWQDTLPVNRRIRRKPVQAGSANEKTPD
jgi:predicted DNA-binding transcriptional regulator AlpA